jgi:hypothetical protein
MVVKLANALRRNERCAGRSMEDLPNGQNLALKRTLSLSRTCGSVQAGDHGFPRGVVPLPHYAVMEANPVVVPGRRNGTIAPVFLGMRCSQGGALFASSRWPLPPGISM